MVEPSLCLVNILRPDAVFESQAHGKEPPDRHGGEDMIFASKFPDRLKFQVSKSDSQTPCSRHGNAS
jgi:hypothetical protein